MSAVYLRDLYRSKVAPALMKDFSFANISQVPQLQKISINVGFGRDFGNKDRMKDIFEDIKLIAGQCPVFTKAKKSIAGFSIREGMDIGVSVTLRGSKMYEFCERLIIAALPRVKDFRGVAANSFDGHGNYSFGITEHQIFFEVENKPYDFGMCITFVTSARRDAECKALLMGLGLPFRS
jgi:large subunit ribosomal protein L5